MPIKESSNRARVSARIQKGRDSVLAAAFLGLSDSMFGLNCCPLGNSSDIERALWKTRFHSSPPNLWPPAATHKCRSLLCRGGRLPRQQNSAPWVQKLRRLFYTEEKAGRYRQGAPEQWMEEDATSSLTSECTASRYNLWTASPRIKASPFTSFYQFVRREIARKG